MASAERTRRWAMFALLASSLGALWFGWREFWFLTDDAFITFRYISNRHLGLGYVWNAPPFRPVEGYSNFLWMVLLDVAWSVFHVEPPSAANVLSLLCAGLTTWRVWSWSSAAPIRPVWRAGLALVFLLANRTFLTWSSSGLETAFFNLLLLLWFEQAWRHGEARRGSGGFALLALWASLATLTRPDGLLAWGATLFLALLPPVRAERSRGWLVAAAGALSLVPIHFLWRRFTYAEWLPNTYYAKHVAPWPEAGWRYLACFVLEYGYWALALLAVAALAVSASQLSREWAAFRLVAAATFVAHTAYYVLRVGGDHFEYRVLSEWVPLLALAWAFLLAELESTGPRLIGIAVSLCAALPIQWAHWDSSRAFTTRNQSWRLKVPVAPRLGPVFAPMTSWFDETQAWLIDHHVCMRHQEHKVFGEEQRRLWPERRWVEAGRGGPPVLTQTTVGLPGWMLPTVAIIDLFGLNDAVVARNPVASDHFRLMAHDRAPPHGYVECLRPNVEIDPSGMPRIVERLEPLTDADVRDCERDFLLIAQGLQEPLPVFVDDVPLAPASPLTFEAFDALANGPDVLLREDFEGSAIPLDRRGLAFGDGPTSRRQSDQQVIVGATGKYLNSYHRGDSGTGLVSFALPKGTRRVALKLAGGANCQALFAGVLEGDRVLAKVCGAQSEALRALVLEIKAPGGDDDGRERRFVAFDGTSEGWGHLIVDDVIALGH